MATPLGPREPARRDEGARLFEASVVPEIPALLRAARALTHNGHDAEDLVQDCLLRAYRGIGGFDGAHPRAWLFTILRNTHVNRNRRRRPALLADPADAEAVASSPESDPAARAENAAFRRAVVEGVAALPEKMRVVVELVDLERCSYAEAATALDVPVGTVMSRLHRGRRQLRERLVTAGLAPGKVHRS
jgi:RNA polymerase sigma-70 factor, ECF subfamily